MPHLTFIGIAVVTLLVGLGLKRNAGQPTAAQQAGRSQAVPSKAAPPSARAGGKVDEQVHAMAPLLLDVSSELTFIIEAEGQQFVTADLERVRERLFAEFGVRVPAFRVRTQAPIAGRGYSLAVDEVPAGKGQLPEGTHFTVTTPQELAVQGVQAQVVTDPLGRHQSSVSAVDAAHLSSVGIAVKGAKDLLAEHVTALLKKRVEHFLGVQEVQVALSGLEQHSPALVKEALQKVPLPLLTDVLKKLLHEQVSIRNLRAILDALVAPSTEGDATALAEKCRVALARQISHQYANNGPLFAHLVDPNVEETLRKGGHALDPADAGAILEGVKKVARQGKAVLLSSPDVRRLLRRLIEGAFPEVAVLTFSELDPELQVRPVGRLAAVAHERG
jgi:type III secretion protein V